MKLYPFQNLSLEFILKVLLRFRKFQPRYSYKIYSYRKKKSVMKKIAAGQGPSLLIQRGHLRFRLNVAIF